MLSLSARMRQSAIESFSRAAGLNYIFTIPLQFALKIETFWENSLDTPYWSDYTAADLGFFH